MRTLTRWVVAGAVACGSSNVLYAQIVIPFVPPQAIPMPFAEKRRIDPICSSIGAATTDRKKASNRAKNNFAAPAPAIPLTFTHFAELQKVIDDDPAKFPPRMGEDDDGYRIENRSILKNLISVPVAGVASPVKVGEGHRVVLVAYVIGARHSNSWPLGSDGESVNCNDSAMNKNDIHIELAESPADIDSTHKRLTAEISPHFRPMSWERFDTDPRTAPHVADIPDINGAKRLTGKPGITDLKGRKVRIYGHLYFDDVHRPCEIVGCAAPSRRATWEIHPVYSIDIEENGEWVPFREWAARR